MRFDPKKPINNSSCNQGALLLAAAKKMTSEEKRALGESLDLIEPVTLVTRMDLGEEAGQQEAVAETVSTMALLMRLGDQDLIEGAIAGPFFIQNLPMVRGGQIFEHPGASVMLEGMALGNARALAMARDRLQDAWQHRSHPFNAQLLGGLKELAAHADGLAPEDVRACAAIAMERHLARELAYAQCGVARNSIKGKSSAYGEEDARFDKLHFAGKMLAAACQEGSSLLSEAAMELGAVPTMILALSALRAGSPALAKTMLALSSQEWDGAKGVARAQFFEELADIADMLLGSMRSRQGASRIKSSGKARALGQLILAAETMGAAKITKEERNSRQLCISSAMGISREFESAKMWIATMRGRFPLAAPAELGTLAKTGQWELCRARIQDAMAAGADGQWTMEMKRELREAAGPSHGDQCGDALGSFFAFEEDGAPEAGPGSKKPKRDKLWMLMLAWEVDAAKNQGERLGEMVSSQLMTFGAEQTAISAAKAKWEAMKLDSAVGKSIVKKSGPRL